MKSQTTPIFHDFLEFLTKNEATKAPKNKNFKKIPRDTCKIYKMQQVRQIWALVVVLEPNIKDFSNFLKIRSLNSTEVSLSPAHG